MNDFNKRTNAQIQREMQDRQFAAAHALEIRRWHRDVAREIFCKQIESGIPRDALDLQNYAIASVSAADMLLSAIMAKPSEEKGGDDLVNADQVDQLNKSLSRYQIPPSEFLATYEIESLDKLPASKFAEAMEAIRT